MGYGQGDYGQGDYGQGDPGLFSSIGHIFSGAVHAATGAIGGFLSGGPLGAIAGAVGGLVHPSSPVIHQAGAGGGSLGLQPVLQQPSSSTTDIGYGLFHHTSSSGMPVLQAGPGGGRYGSPGQSGYHQIRRGPHAGMWVRNRRMNVANPRALRRSIRRARGFEHMAKRVLGFSSPHKPKGRVYFKKSRKS